MLTKRGSDGSEMAKDGRQVMSSAGIKTEIIIQALNIGKESGRE